MICCCRFLTVGLLILTCLYIGMVILMSYLLPVECLDDKCQTEGVDNTIINWSSDFFLAISFFIFALHLSFCGPNNAVLKSGILAQVFMGGAFVLAGIGHWLYPNSGLDDDHGMLGYWIVWIGSSIFFTISGLAMAHFALKATENLDPTLKNMCFTHNKAVALCELILVLSLSGFLTGGIWCSMKPEVQLTTVLDEYEPTSDVDVCFRIVYWSDVAMKIAYALLWLPVGFFLKAASIQRPQTILGLPTPIAAGTAMLLQWSAGSMYPVYLAFVAYARRNEQTFLGIWQNAYGTVIYHWGMLLTLYCLHNLSYALIVGSLDDDDDEPPLLSLEWFLVQLGFRPKNDPEKQKKKKRRSSKQGNQENSKKEEVPVVTNGNNGSETDGEEVDSKKSVKFVEEEEVNV